MICILQQCRGGMNRDPSTVSAITKSAYNLCNVGIIHVNPGCAPITPVRESHELAQCLVLELSDLKHREGCSMGVMIKTQILNLSQTAPQVPAFQFCHNQPYEVACTAGSTPNWKQQSCRREREV